MLEKYRMVSVETEAMIVEKKSKFICNLYPCEDEAQVDAYLQAIRKLHYGARHHCYAYRLVNGSEVLEKCSDDGEPSGTAGKPMLEVLRGAGLCNTLVVVTRYFGGTLLGTGGLVKAYTESTQEAVGQMKTENYEWLQSVRVTVDYGFSAKLEHTLRAKNYRLKDAEYTDCVTYELLLPPGLTEAVQNEITELTNGSLLWENGNSGFVKS